MVIEAVIFDLDGTLAHFNLDYKALRSEARTYLIRIGVPTSVLKINESIFEMLKKAEIFAKNNGKTAEYFEAVRAEVLAIAERYEMEAAASTNLLPGAVDALKELKKMRLKMGLCTTSSEKAANYILNRFRINEFFQIVIPRNKVKHVKPNTEQFEMALKALGVHPKDALIIGDSVVDMESAKELKAVAVGLPTGFSSTQELMIHGANYLITSLSDLPILVKKINEA
ncbi:MAG: HAD family phosphatase [Candidatus Bathyarchaeota archaeon]|nr:HAD family phosphatase [Candidatus Bathyarchaeota archaeon]